MKISGSILKDSIPKSLVLVSGLRFSIRFAISASCRSFKVWFMNSIFLFSIFCVKVVINYLLKSKLTFFASRDFGKVINTSISFFETNSLYNDKIQIKWV